jgi:hypothetical protein
LKFDVAADCPLHFFSAPRALSAMVLHNVLSEEPALFEIFSPNDLSV